MMTKLAVALALTVVAVVRSDVTKNADDHNIDTAYKNHSLILGQRRYGDSLIHIDIAKKSPIPFRIVETYIMFPSNGEKNNKTINQLQILDTSAKGHGGSSYVTHGGPGAKYVILRFKSQRGHGLDFIVGAYT